MKALCGAQIHNDGIPSYCISNFCAIAVMNK